MRMHACMYVCMYVCMYCSSFQLTDHGYLPVCVSVPVFIQGGGCETVAYMYNII